MLIHGRNGAPTGAVSSGAVSVPSAASVVVPALPASETPAVPASEPGGDAPAANDESGKKRHKHAAGAAAHGKTGAHPRALKDPFQ
jgi:hypothetical protein